MRENIEKKLSTSGTRQWQPQILCKVASNFLNARDPLDWLNRTHFAEGVFALAHAVDGVNWGRSTPTGFVFSHQVTPNIAPPLHHDTLQQLRVFTASWEYFFWHDGQHWWRRVIKEVRQGKAVPAFDEDHLLWGTQTEHKSQGFSTLTDGAQGLRHVVPIETPKDLLNRRVVLRVRHYLDEYANGTRYIALSRLMNVEVKTYE